MNHVQAQNSSQAFFLAYQRCMEKRPLPNDQVQCLVVPAVVCAAFSIELGFKALTLRFRAGDSMHGHNLKTLFSGLEAPIQEQIIEAVGIAEPQFYSSLQEESDAFAVWRYVYEQTSENANIEFLSKLSKATQDVLSK